MAANLAQRAHKARERNYTVGAYRGKREQLVLWPNDAEQTPYTAEQIHAMLDCTVEDPCPKCIVIRDSEETLERLKNFIGLVARGRDNS